MVILPTRRTSAVVVATSLAAIAVLTLWPLAETRSLATFCIFCGPFGAVDFVLNTILFVPLGLGLRWLSGGWKKPMIVGVLTTLFIESMQFRFVQGRDASLGDLVANTLGATIGIRLGLEVIRWLNASGDSARRLAGVFGILASGVVFLSASLLQPLSTRGLGVGAREHGPFSSPRDPSSRVLGVSPPLALTLFAVFASPFATGLSQAGFGEWLGIICGVAVGAAIERWSFRQSPDHLTQRAA